METSDFAKTWSEIWAERQSLFNRRTELETDLCEIRTKISHLDEVLSHLGPLAGMANSESLPALGITDAIRSILHGSEVRLSAPDIRKELSEKGYDLSGLSAPMASIYKILSRLEGSDEVEREKEEGRVYYKWKVPPISDEDIPF
jgi:hypothetical protein